MTTENKNGLYLKWFGSAIGFLLMLVISLILYTWNQADARITAIEQKVDVIDDRSLKGQWMDSLIITQLDEIKEELKK